MISADDLNTVIIESGALRHPWYSHVNVSDSEDGNRFILTFRDSGADEPDAGDYVITSEKLAHTVVMIADAAEGDTSILDETRNECDALRTHGWEETDFDSVSADQVIQVAAFGRVIYG